jgi:hypothetical protein
VLRAKRAGKAQRNAQRAAPGGFLEIVLSLTARSVAGDRLVIRAENSA